MASEQNQEKVAQAREAYQQTYFAKLAECGIIPANEEHAQELLALAPKARKVAAMLAEQSQSRLGELTKTAGLFMDKILNGDEGIDQLIAKQAAAAAKAGA